MLKRAVLVSVALATGLLVGVVAGPASGQTLSSGCQIMNSPLLDGHFAGATMGRLEPFFAGEQITVTAAEPTSVGDPTTHTLRISNTVVDTTEFPGTVSYTFPADTTATVQWSSDSGANLTVSMSCQLAPPLPTSAEQCKKGGYEAFNFENQGDCVSFVATEGSNEPGQNVPNT